VYQKKQNKITVTSSDKSIQIKNNSRPTPKQTKGLLQTHMITKGKQTLLAFNQLREVILTFSKSCTIDLTLFKNSRWFRSFQGIQMQQSQIMLRNERQGI